MSIGKIMGKIVKILPKAEGSAGKITLGRTQLTELAKQDKQAGKLYKKLWKMQKNPHLI